MARSLEQVVRDLAGCVDEKDREMFVEAVLSGKDAKEQVDITIGLLRALKKPQDTL